VPIATNQSCPHDHRPGTTVCLHCRHAAIVASRKRRRQSVLRVAGAVLGVIVLTGGGTFGTYATRGYIAQRQARGATTQIAQQGGAIAVAAASEAPRPAKPLPQRSSGPVPIIALGETRLADSVRAVRADTGVTVFFDLTMIRTRRSDKFEHFLRSTLPEIYGPTVDSLLTLIPQGMIARQGDLLTELPVKGVKLALANGWKLTVWPEIRPGYEGPLVVRYRVMAE
jgi:hypothetical protein